MTFRIGVQVKKPEGIFFIMRHDLSYSFKYM